MPPFPYPGFRRLPASSVCVYEKSLSQENKTHKYTNNFNISFAPSNQQQKTHVKGHVKGTIFLAKIVSSISCHVTWKFSVFLDCTIPSSQNLPVILPLRIVHTSNVIPHRSIKCLDGPCDLGTNDHKPHHIWWQSKSGTEKPIPFDGVPFYLVGTSVLEYQHGMDRNIYQKKKHATFVVNITICLFYLP